MLNVLSILPCLRVGIWAACTLLLILPEIGGHRFEETNSSLPRGGRLIQAHFDGEDSIYLFGAFSTETWSDLYRYSLSRDEVETVTRWPSGVTGSYGSVYDRAGNIITIGDHPQEGFVTGIWRVNVTDPQDFELLGTLPHSLTRPGLTWDPAGYMYLFGGHSTETAGFAPDVWKFEPRTGTLVRRAPLPNLAGCPNAVFDSQRSQAYIFGGEFGLMNGDAYARRDILRLNTSTTQQPRILTTALPQPTAYSCTVWTGTEAYVIGGTDLQPSPQYAGVSKFTPDTGNRLETVRVQTFPSRLLYHACVYVERLKRVYIFGGDVGDSPALNHINFIQLEDGGPGPEPTSCDDLPNGAVLPNLRSCESFHQCYSRTSYTYRCPEQLLFSSEAATCVFPHLSNCVVSFRT